jgi:hypothetical protein
LKKKGKFCFVIYIAGERIFFFIYEVFAKQKKENVLMITTPPSPQRWPSVAASPPHTRIHNNVTRRQMHLINVPGHANGRFHGPCPLARVEKGRFHLGFGQLFPHFLQPRALHEGLTCYGFIVL